MLKVPVIKGNLNKALKIFKKKFKSTGVVKEIRERQQYTKKSTKRRLIKDKASKPNLIIIDGGKGQLNVLKNILLKYNINDINSVRKYFSKMF